MTIENNLNWAKKDRFRYEQDIKGKFRDSKFKRGVMLLMALLGGTIVANKNQLTRLINKSIELFEASLSGLTSRSNQYIQPKPIMPFTNTSLPLYGPGEAPAINSFNSASGNEGVGIPINIAANISCLAHGLAAQYKNRKKLLKIENETPQQLSSNL